MRLHRYVRIYGKKVAFTLVELLVVTAIVGVLMALLFPLAKSLTGKADTTACAANLRKIGAGHGAYIADNAGMLIPAATQCEGGRTWYQLLEPYLGGPTDGSEDLYSPARPAWQTCPAKKFPADQKMWLSVGYGWNQVYFGSSGSGEPDITYNPSYRRLSEVTQPSKTIIIADNMDHFVSGSVWQYALLYGPYGSGGMLAKRHQGGGNYLFMDGHVEWMSPTNATREVEGKDWYLFRRDKL